MSKSLPVILVLAGILAVPIIGAAQTTPGAPSPPAYRPGLGDLMTMTVQPRHIKLALAGREKNWTYAAYELHELEEAFERAARVWPQWRSVPIADMMASSVKEPIVELAQAIKAADGAKFDTAYGELTKACNGCHLGAGRGMIAIKVPDASMFPDQDFKPAKQ
jgi:hypothetical protein